MEGLISYGLLAGLVGGLALALLAIIISVLMRQIFKSWTAPRLATFSSAFGPVLLGIPILALSLSVVSGMILVSGPEAQGFVALCAATIVASITGFLLGRRIVLTLLEKAQAQ